MTVRPYSNFFWSDYRGDAKLRVCSLAARGLWMEFLAIMHEANPRGNLLIENSPPNDRQLAILCGCSLKELRKLKQELLAAGVPSIDGSGIWFSRRMQREEHRSRVNKMNGIKGGNPTLLDNRKSESRLTEPDNQIPSNGLIHSLTVGLTGAVKPHGIGSGTSHNEETLLGTEIGGEAENPFGEEVA